VAPFEPMAHTSDGGGISAMTPLACLLDCLRSCAA